MADVGELIELPNGTRVYYVDEAHAYYRCKPNGDRGRRLTGVSTVCAPLDFKPDGLLRWAEKLTLEGVVRGFGGQEVPNDPHILRQMLDTSGLRWEQIREEAAQRGTNVHVQMLHALATGDEIPNLDDLPDEQRGYGQAVMAWWLARKPEVIYAEQVVLSEEHGFAGRGDLWCRVTRGVIAPELWLLDAKTSGFISAKAHAQIAGYDLGAIASGLTEGPADRLVILQLRDDGTYREITSHASHDDFLAALTVYRAAGRINGAAKKDRVAADQQERLAA